MRSVVKAKLRKNRIIAFFVGMAAVFSCIILLTQIMDTKAKNQDLAARSKRLDMQIEEQHNRQEELRDNEEYIRTKEYIEERAKAIGYVYPDEIIFKQED